MKIGQISQNPKKYINLINSTFYDQGFGSSRLSIYNRQNSTILGILGTLGILGITIIAICRDYLQITTQLTKTIALIS